MGKWREKLPQPPFFPVCVGDPRVAHLGLHDGRWRRGKLKTSGAEKKKMTKSWLLLKHFFFQTWANITMQYNSRHMWGSLSHIQCVREKMFPARGKNNRIWVWGKEATTKISVTPLPLPSLRLSLKNLRIAASSDIPVSPPPIHPSSYFPRQNSRAKKPRVNLSDSHCFAPPYAQLQRGPHELTHFFGGDM